MGCAEFHAKAISESQMTSGDIYDIIIYEQDEEMLLLDTTHRSLGSSTFTPGLENAFDKDNFEF